MTDTFIVIYEISHLKYIGGIMFIGSLMPKTEVFYSLSNNYDILHIWAISK